VSSCVLKTWLGNCPATVFKKVCYLSSAIYTNLNQRLGLQYLDAVGWVFWPVKPTTESENWLQLDSLSTSVNIDHLTMVNNTSAVGNDSRPWVVPQSIKWLSIIMRERRIHPSGFRVWWNSSSLRDIFVPPYRQRLTGSSWQQQQTNAENVAHINMCCKRYSWGSADVK